MASVEELTVHLSHTVADYEGLRTSAVRTLASEVSLLADALHALRNGAPHITEEFLDRAITALQAELVNQRNA